MPIQYEGISVEHKAVRSGMGLFDLSHMGEFSVTGGNYLSAIDALMANEIANLDVWQARYTPMCLESGGIVDDLLVYRYPDFLMLVVNASNIEKDLAWTGSHIPSGVRLENISDETALIAVQGPHASGLVQTMTPTSVDAIDYYHFALGEVAGAPATISRTGYTGEDGLELYVAAEDATKVWRALLEAGSPKGLVPVGLGARDTLRLEAGLALYGNDIDEQTTPIEGGLGWTLKLDGRDFVGASALREQLAEGPKRRSVAFEMLDRGVPRPHCDVVVEAESVGEVTSGTFSPSFSKGLGLASVQRSAGKPGNVVEIDIRGTRHPAQIVKRPIYRRSS